MPPATTSESVGLSASESTEAINIHSEESNRLLVTKENRFIDIGALIPSGWQRTLFRVVQPIVEYTFGFPDLWKLHAATILPPYEPGEISRRAFKHLHVSWEMSDEEIEELKAIEGPLVLVANHPFGGIDFLALVQMMERIRPSNWKFISNIMTNSIKGFGDRFIPLDPLGTSSNSNRLNREGLYASTKYLKQGGMLCLFPAARVSHKQKQYAGQVADRPWSTHFLRQASRVGATVACLHIPGSNSKSFLKIPTRWPKLRGLFLTRELTRPNVKKVVIKLASVYSPKAVARLANTSDGVEQIRAACFQKSDQAIPRPPPVLAPQASALVAEPPSSHSVYAELEQLKSSDHGKLVDYKGFTLYFAPGKAIPKTLQALGLGREYTFRVAGQGTGKASDLSPEDDYYHHLILWDREQVKIAGAYRIGVVQQILENHGTQGLYLDHVFKIDPQLYKIMGPSFELSRSYILPSYQGDPDALAGLWRGLGEAARRLNIKTLFGSVTISNDHHPASRAILVEYLRNNQADSQQMQSLVQARTPFRPQTHYHRMVANAYRGQPLQRLTPVIQSIESNERGIPPLIRYYCNLGARFIDYHVEAEFGNSLYCLLRVELSKVPQAYLERFMPDEKAL